jgi:hypothetical protein
MPNYEFHNFADSYLQHTNFNWKAFTWKLVKSLLTFVFWVLMVENQITNFIHDHFFYYNFNFKFPNGKYELIFYI